MYENKCYSEENFDIIITGKHQYVQNIKVRNSSRVSYSGFEQFQTLYFSKKKHTYTELTTSEKSSITYSNGILNMKFEIFNL